MSAVLAVALAAAAAQTRNVAIVVYAGVELLDFAGPGEVFAAAANAGAVRGVKAFRVYTVARSKEPIVSQGFLKVTPDYSIADAPRPDLLVIPGGSSGVVTRDEAFMAWAKKAAGEAEIAMSVCSGAFVLGKAGLLDGKSATTWYGAISRLRSETPKADVQEGRRFIDQGRILTTAGVSAGIDGALHVVARLLGRAVADHTARYMEYHWTPEPYLAQNYPQLDPRLDARGRAAQQASFLEDEGNWQEAAKAWRALVAQDAKDGFAWDRLAVALAQSGDIAGAIDAGTHAAEIAEGRAGALVNLACIYARAGRRDDALRALELAVGEGFSARWRLENDRDFDPLRSDARFQKLLARL
jgi:transcriptional regulator GlxA family with amidase domain